MFGPWRTLPFRYQVGWCMASERLLGLCPGAATAGKLCPREPLSQQGQPKARAKSSPHLRRFLGETSLCSSRPSTAGNNRNTGEQSVKAENSWWPWLGTLPPHCGGRRFGIPGRELRYRWLWGL